MRKLGYIRTSTDKQLIDRQLLALEEYCDQVYVEDGVSALSKSRPVFDAVMAELQAGDAFVVSSLDRAFRSSLDALRELERLDQRGIQFLSLSQQFDTSSPDGKLLFSIAAALSEWERSILSERTKQGLIAARLRGKTLGRPRKLTKEQIAEARVKLEVEFKLSITELAQELKVHEKTIERALHRDRNAASSV